MEIKMKKDKTKKEKRRGNNENCSSEIRGMKGKKR